MSCKSQKFALLYIISLGQRTTVTVCQLVLKERIRVFLKTTNSLLFRLKVIVGRLYCFRFYTLATYSIHSKKDVNPCPSWIVLPVILSIVANCYFVT